jgi:PAS domain S-box-containing protein
MERGLVSPSFDCIEKLCDALGTAPVELFRFKSPDIKPAPPTQDEHAVLDTLVEKDAILKSLPGLTLKCVDQDMRLIWFSTASPDSILNDAASCVGRPCYEALHGLEAPCPECLLPDVLMTGEPLEGEVTAPNGLSFLTRCTPVTGPDGSVSGAIHLTLDISDRKRVEEELRSVRQRLEHLLATGPAVLYSCEAGGDYAATYISDNMHSLFGHAPQSFIGRPDYWFSNLYPGEKERLLERMPLLFERGSLTQEFRFRHGNGSWRFIRDDLRLVRDEEGNPKEVVGSWLDTTDAKAAELAMRESESRYKNLFMTNCTVQLLIDAESGAILDANPAACAFYGYSSHEIRSKTLGDINLLPPDELAEKLREARMRDTSMFRFRHRLANGEIRDVETRTSLMNHGGRSVLHSLIIDVTENEEFKRRIMQLNREWEEAFVHGPHGLAMLDQDLRVLSANRLTARLLDADPDSLQGARCRIRSSREGWPPQPGQTISAEVTVDGYETQLNVTITTLPPTQGTPLRYFMVSLVNYAASGD